MSPLPRRVTGDPMRMQKFGASVLVTVGVTRDLFGTPALLVAVFDFATAVLCGLMWHRLAHPGERPAHAEEVRT